MQDRLPDLCSYYTNVADKNASDFQINNSVVINVKSANTQLFDIEQQMGLRNKTQSDFLSEVSELFRSIKSNINVISETNSQIASLRLKINEATDPNHESALKAELNTTLSNTNQVALKLKRELDQFQVLNEKAKQSSGTSHMRDNLYVATAKRFRDVMKEYQSLQTSIKKSIRDKAERQIRVVFPDIQKDELNTIMEDGELSAQTAMKMQLSGQAHQSLQLAVSEIQDKYNDIKTLEKTVQELHQLFVDLSTLIADQDDLLDQVDYSVNTAADYTAKGERELIAARKSQKKMKKRVMCISITVCIVAVLILLPVILTLTR